MVKPRVIEGYTVIARPKRAVLKHIVAADSPEEAIKKFVQEFGSRFTVEGVETSWDAWEYMGMCEICETPFVDTSSVVMDEEGIPFCERCAYEF